MSKGRKKDPKKRGSVKKASAGKLPKSKCCVSKDRCGRCPIRMLKEGTLPDGYGVHKRKLVRADAKKSARKLANAA